MSVIKFSELWEKLKPENFKEGAEFTTFRGYEPRKMAYCLKALKEKKVFYVVLNGTPEVLLGTAMLKQVSCRWSSELTWGEMQADTYPSWMKSDFTRFIKKLYGMDVVFGIWLHFTVMSVHR